MKSIINNLPTSGELATSEDWSLLIVCRLVLECVSTTKDKIYDINFTK